MIWLVLEFFLDLVLDTTSRSSFGFDWMLFTLSILPSKARLTSDEAVFQSAGFVDELSSKEWVFVDMEVGRRSELLFTSLIGCVEDRFDSHEELWIDC